MKTTQQPKSKKSKGFSAAERAAMKDRVREMQAEATETDVLSKIAAMPAPDRGLAERLHALIRKNAPALSPKLWYGMPAYANDSGKIVCFFQGAHKFKTRYATFGFQPDANLDEGAMWPVAFAVKALTAADEAKIAALVKKAVS